MRVALIEPTEILPLGRPHQGGNGLIHSAGANVVGLIDINHEDPAVANLTGSCSLGYDLDDVVNAAVVGNDLHHRFGQKRYLIFKPAVDGSLAFLMPVSPDVGYGQTRREAFNPLNQVVELLRTDDALDEFHAGIVPSLYAILNYGSARCRCCICAPC